MLQIDKAKRLADMNVFIVPHMTACAQRCIDRAFACFGENLSRLEETFLAAIQAGVEETAALQAQGLKQEVRYIHFSYLISGAVTKEELLKVDFYDHRHYADLAETDCCWDYSALFPTLREDAQEMGAILKRHFLRVMDYEIEELFLGYRMLIFQPFQQICTALAVRPDFWSAVSPVCGELTDLLYGGYLSQSERIGQFETAGESQ